jgi:hypothetical protein
MATIRFVTPGPSTTTIIIASRISGNESSTSTARMIAVST